MSATLFSNYIYVLTQGKVCQSGIHGELIKTEGLYKKCVTNKLNFLVKNK